MKKAFLVCILATLLGGCAKPRDLPSSMIPTPAQESMFEFVGSLSLGQYTSVYVARTRVSGGWLYYSVAEGGTINALATGQTFVPDIQAQAERP